MEVRYSRDPQSFEGMNTSEIRDEFLVADLFTPNEIKLIYLHIDRIIVGSAVPTSQPLVLEAGAELRAEYFAERREVGVFGSVANNRSKLQAGRIKRNDRLRPTRLSQRAQR